MSSLRATNKVASFNYSLLAAAWYSAPAGLPKQVGTVAYLAVV